MRSDQIHQAARIVKWREFEKVKIETLKMTKVKLKGTHKQELI